MAGKANDDLLVTTDPNTSVRQWVRW